MRKVLPLLTLLALLQTGHIFAQTPWLGVHGGLSIPDLSARFEYGFINIQKYSEDGSNNTGNLLLSLGWSHRLGK